MSLNIQIWIFKIIALIVWPFSMFLASWYLNEEIKAQVSGENSLLYFMVIILMTNIAIDQIKWILRLGFSKEVLSLLSILIRNTLLYLILAVSLIVIPALLDKYFGSDPLWLIPVLVILPMYYRLTIATDRIITSAKNNKRNRGE